MATDTSGTRSVYNTLSSTTVDTVELKGSWRAIEVVNFDATNALWITIGEAGNQNAQAPTPAVEGNECFYIAPKNTLVLDTANGASITPQVKILGNGGDYGVIGHPSANTARSTLA